MLSQENMNATNMEIKINVKKVISQMKVHGNANHKININGYYS